MSAQSCSTPFTIIVSQSIVEEVHSQSNCFGNGAAKQHGCFPSKYKGLDQTKLVVEVDRQVDCPVADSLVIAAKVKGAICLLELDLVDRKSKLAQVLEVSHQRSHAHEEGRSSRVHHRTVRSFSTCGIFKHHHAAFKLEGHALHSLAFRSIASWC